MMRPAVDLPRVYLCHEPVDFRKGMRSLAVLVEQALGRDPFAETLYVFVNRRRDAVKCLYWERNLALAKRFGRSSEQGPAAQLGLFNEAEQLAAESAPDAEQDAPADIQIPAHSRRHGGRKPPPDYLPRLRIEHDLPEGEKTCTCGCRLTRIGEEVSEQLDVIPAQVRVLQHVRGKCACKACEETIAAAPLPAQPIPKSNASPGLLAHITCAK
jgi:transposase